MMKRTFFAAALLLAAQTIHAQTNGFSPDTTQLVLQSEAIYARPFLKNNPLPFAVGGYMDANSYYGGTNGQNNGLSFEMPDFTLFLASHLRERVRFLSEIAFESSTKNVQLRYAALDVQLHRMFNLRGGMLLNPIGAFNQNHDGPLYEFADRPLSATTIIPGIFSNVGFALYGKTGNADWVAGYELSVTNGFNDKIINNATERTSLQAGVSGMENFSGRPTFTGKISVKNRYLGELGISGLTGVYSEWQAEKQQVHILAVDYMGSFLHNRLIIKGELAKVMLDVPATYIQTYGQNQLGAYVDVVGTLINRPMLGWQNARINLALRMEYVDYNQDKFVETSSAIADHIYAIVPGISFRPNAKMVFRVNYRYQEQTDFLGNKPAKTGAVQFGISSYF